VQEEESETARKSIEEPLFEDYASFDNSQDGNTQEVALDDTIVINQSGFNTQTINLSPGRFSTEIKPNSSLMHSSFHRDY